MTNRLCNVLVAHGLQRGDRLAVLLPQAPETAIAHVAGFKAGLITIPLFALFGAEALEYRLGDSGARVLVTDRAGYEKVAPLRDRCRVWNWCSASMERRRGPLAFRRRWRGLGCVRAVDTGPDDPAVIIYTSGTTGSPKGALHAHRVLLGPSARRGVAARVLPAAGRPVLDSGGLGVDRRAVRRAAAGWHHGVPVLAHRFAQVRPAGGVGADDAP